ncbi:thymidylate synthase [Breoghania sp. JC706]|uniref:thymidylate synthase n=1 Tax=Breoghania sp. JC706 TaxID=3117732 RepID=UPI00300A801E
MTDRFETFDDMYRSTIAGVLSAPEFHNAPRGNAEIEVLGFSAVLHNPLARVCFSPLRRQNIVFNYAEALWYLSGRNDLAFIERYAPRMKRYSADGKTLPGTGYGRKLLAFGPDRIDQIERVIDILGNDDPDSKRAFLQIFDANEDLYRRNIDVSCTLGLQLLLRDGALHMVAFMRANDAYIGFLSDVFSFTLIQEYIARRLGVCVGRYYHHVGSIHIYEPDLERARALAAEQRRAPGIGYPEMPATSPETIEDVLCAEGEIRKGNLDLDDVLRFSVPAYWRDILVLFWLHARKPEVSARALEALHPLHRHLFTQRRMEAVN